MRTTGFAARGRATRPVWRPELITNNSHGVYLANQSTPVITRDASTNTGCTITSNVYGVYINEHGHNTMPQPLINYNSIFGNATYDIGISVSYDQSNQSINARNNWWGTIDISNDLVTHL